MLKLKESHLFGKRKYDVICDNRVIGLIFERDWNEDWPEKFQVTGNGTRGLFPTLLKCVKYIQKNFVYAKTP